MEVGIYTEFKGNERLPRNACIQVMWRLAYKGIFRGNRDEQLHNKLKKMQGIAYEKKVVIGKLELLRWDS